MDSFDKALCQVVKYDCIELSKFMITNGANVNYVDQYNRTPINYACGHNQISQIKFLIEHGVKDIPKEYNFSKLLNNAYNNKDLEFIKKLLDHNIDLNVFLNNKKETLLYIACRDGDINLVKLLLEYESVNINLGNDHNTTPLRIACVQGYSEIVKILMDAGANPNIQGLFD